MSDVDDARPRAREDVILRSVAGDWVLYDPRTQDLHVLNVTAAAVWSCADGTRDVAAIAEALGEHLDGAPEPDEIRTDVERVLARFGDDGLLE